MQQEVRWREYNTDTPPYCPYSTPVQSAHTVVDPSGCVRGSARPDARCWSCGELRYSTVLILRTVLHSTCTVQYRRYPLQHRRAPPGPIGSESHSEAMKREEQPLPAAIRSYGGVTDPATRFSSPTQPNRPGRDRRSSRPIECSQEATVSCAPATPRRDMMRILCPSHRTATMNRASDRTDGAASGRSHASGLVHAGKTSNIEQFLEGQPFPSRSQQASTCRCRWERCFGPSRTPMFTILRASGSSSPSKSERNGTSY
jgi:hypothetical protein